MLICHVGPFFHSREKDMGFNLIDAAVSETQRPGNLFKHSIFSSSLCTLVQHDFKSYVEERLFLRPLNFTVRQLTNFMDAYSALLLATGIDPS
ncbi:uncharacterized protein BCR38DRAFT_513657 [Pseudomassariella vexata]|uniref:Uncharacterized protein n=1 Tax=Pseudomassariella vexata TaxID=1141098 RepID=A0A1Y2E1B9_9PEZI|nr:uncharacterized protein BCR38DRAFT_513657 [Pseudomassariella vexata]ORY65134.1 hypothetical protein BCR38DRAFT_513657 [Pseudomassariella vexata]